MLGVAITLVKSANPHNALFEDNDFAEFEEFDEEEEGKYFLHCECDETSVALVLLLPILKMY